MDRWIFSITLVIEIINSQSFSLINIFHSAHRDFGAFGWNEKKNLIKSENFDFHSKKAAATRRFIANYIFFFYPPHPHAEKRRTGSAGMESVRGVESIIKPSDKFFLGENVFSCNTRTKCEFAVWNFWLIEWINHFWWVVQLICISRRVGSRMEQEIFFNEIKFNIFKELKKLINSWN